MPGQVDGQGVGGLGLHQAFGGEYGAWSVAPMDVNQQDFEQGSFSPSMFPRRTRRCVLSRSDPTSLASARR